MSALQKPKAPTIRAYNAAQTGEAKKICAALVRELTKGLKGAESKVWHGGPVWFYDGNPVAGYWKRKSGVMVMFWSGMSFDEPGLEPIGNVKKFKAAGKNYGEVKDIDRLDLRRWLKKAKTIQWDYKNIIKRRGKLVRLR